MPKVKIKPSASSEAASSENKLANGSPRPASKKKPKSWEMTAQEALRINYVDHEISPEG